MLNKKVWWLFCALCCFGGLFLIIKFVFLKVDPFVVTISDGLIRGSQSVDLNGDNFYSFYNIPYAKAPVGDLRFKAPQPVDPWNEIKDATKYGHICFQENSKGASEDCLSINVFTKSLPQVDSALKPVMVYIHGGQFLIGSGQRNPEYIMTEDIVLVTINYRLSALGFLFFKDPALKVPGNAGLKDQQLALRWVQKNIKYFNGDPDKVTIFGPSAGGVSVNYHLVAPNSKSLFSRAIAQSGSVGNPWAISNFDAIGFCEFLTGNVLTEEECLEVVNGLPADVIVEGTKGFLENKTLTILGPVIEYPNENAFITKHPMDVINAGEQSMVPVIYGYNKDEGIYFDIKLNIREVNETHKYRRNKIIEEKLSEYNVQNTDMYLPFEKNLPCETDFNNETQLRLILDIVLNYYIVGKVEQDKIKLNTDAMFVMGIINSAIHTARTSSQPVYLYRFSQFTNLNTISRYGYKKYNNTASHGEDGAYLFKFPMDEKLFGDRERKSVLSWVKLWTNFAKFGNPTPDALNLEWKPIQNESIYFLDMNDEIKLNSDPEKERRNLWKRIYEINPETHRYL